MRFLKILGMVVALHVVLFTFFLLSPGCQSNPASSPPPAASTDPAPVTAPPPATAENWSSQPTASAPASGGASLLHTIESTPDAGLSNVDQIRSAPSRPDNPSAYVSTGDSAPAALNPPPTQHVVRSGDNLAKIAKSYGITTADLQRINPGVKPTALRPGQILKLPGNVAGSSPAASSPAGVSSAATSSRYTVRSGDSLSVIAARNGTTVTALRQANNLRGDTIQVGQELVIPGGKASTSPSTSYSSEPSPSRISADASATTFRHTIRSGETLGVIAKRYDVTVAEIMAANQISDPRKIRAGSELIIPGYTGGATAPAPKAPERNTTPPPSTPEQTTPEPLPEPEPLVPADMTDAPPIPVDEPTPTP